MGTLAEKNYNLGISRPSITSQDSEPIEKGKKSKTMVEMVQFQLQVLHVIQNLVEYCRLSRLIELVSSCSKPEYAHVNDRLESFKCWGYGLVQEAERLAEAGFYWTGNDDRVRCFMCNGGLCNWEKQDIPLYEHSKWFNRCPYILECQKDEVGHAIIDTASILNKSEETNTHHCHGQGQTHCHGQGQTQCDTDVARPIINKPVEQACQSSQKHTRPHDTVTSRSQGGENEMMLLAEENSSLRSSLECKVCLDKRVNVIFLPCSHLVCCLECSLQVSHCPVCRKDIKATAKVIL